MPPSLWPPLLLATLAAAEPDAHPAPVNYLLGTQTIGVKYGFTADTRLVETARAILELGSNLLKISLGANYADSYALPHRDDVGELRDLVAHEPSYRAVLDLPFAYYHLWCYPFCGTKWADGLSATEAEREYGELRRLADYLLTTFSGTGKRFYLGHWEGDWHLHPGYDRNREPEPERLQGMIDWLNTRQRAIDDAKRETPHHDVEVYGYTEVNLVRKALAGGTTLTTHVLPHTTVDYVSYSAYDSLLGGKDAVRTVEAMRERLVPALDCIEAHLPPKPGLTGKRVWIGEFGYPLEQVGAPERQAELSRTFAAAAIEWGCPFVLYWELYCNEVRDGRHRGFWLIDDQGLKQPVYHSFQGYYRRAKEWLAAQPQPPTEAGFREQAVRWLLEPAG